LLANAEVRVHAEAATNAAPLPVPLSWGADTGIILSHSILHHWLTKTVASLVSRLESLESDCAIVEHIEEFAAPTDYLSLRFAALLARYVGNDKALIRLIERAAQAQTAADLLLSASNADVHRNDRDANLLMWTHERFLRFLESAPR
jgi:hypothetical protein